MLRGTCILFILKYIGADVGRETEVVSSPHIRKHGAQFARRYSLLLPMFSRMHHYCGSIISVSTDICLTTSEKLWIHQCTKQTKCIHPNQEETIIHQTRELTGSDIPVAAMGGVGCGGVGLGCGGCGGDLKVEDRLTAYDVMWYFHCNLTPFLLSVYLQTIPDIMCTNHFKWEN